MFWDNFSRICDERDTNPSAACIAAGMQKNRPYNWKTGSLPKQDEMIALARVLDCTVADFFADEPLKEFPTGAPLNSYEYALLEVFDDLDPMDQAEVMVFVRNLRDKREKETRERYGA